MPLLQRKGNPNAVKSFSLPEAQAALASGEWEGRDGTPDVGVRSSDEITHEERNLPLTEALRRQSEFDPVSVAAPVYESMDTARHEQFGTGGQKLLTAAEGIGASLSLGGSDWLLNALGADTADRAQESPGVRALSEIGATIGTTVLTGGLGGAVKGALGKGLAAATPLGMVTSRTGKLANAIGGVKGLAAAESVEGLVTAGGGVISKLAIKDEELTAKAALLDLGLGTLVGAAAGGITGGLFKLSKGAGASVPKKGLDFDAPETVALDKALGDATKMFKEADKHLGKRAEISRIGDLPDQVLADGYTARNIIQVIDDVAEGNVDLALATGRAAKELKRARQARRAVDGLIQPQGEEFGTAATKGRSALYGPENAYKTTADVPALRQALQEYYEATVDLGKKVGLDDSAAKIMGGTSGKYASKIPGFDELSQPKTIKITADDIPVSVKEQVSTLKDVNRLARVKKGLETGDLDAEPIRFTVAPDGGLDIVDGRHRLRNLIDNFPERKIPVVFEQGLEGSGRYSRQIASKTVKGPGLQRFFDEVNAAVPEADVAALNAARKSFEEAGDYTVRSLTRLNHGDLLAKLTKLDQYHTEMLKVADTLKVPGMTESLEQFSAKATQQLENMTGLSAADIDKSYTEILRAVGLEAPTFKGPAADLHRVWTVQQAMKQGGELGEVLHKAAREAEDLATNKQAFEAGENIKEPFGKRALRSGARRAAGYMGFTAGNAMGGPIVGAALAGSVSEAVSQGLRRGGMLSSATGKLLGAISIAAGLAGKTTRMAGVNVGTVIRNTSFGGAEPNKRETSRQSYERITGEITAALGDPGLTQRRLNENLGEIRDVNWGVGDKIEVQAMDAMNYLAGNIPKDPGVLQKWGLSTWKPTDAQVLEFNNRVAAVVDPMNSITRFMAGGGSPAEADAIRQVHPEIFREFQAAFMDNLPNVRDKIKGSTRVRLGILFDAPIDSRLRPEFRQFMKEHWVARAEDQKPIDVNAGMTQEQPSPAQKLLG